MASPAAVLSILVEANTRNATTGLTKLQRHLGAAERRSDKFAKQTSLHARLSSRGFSGIAASARGATAGIGALVAGGGYLIKQFEDSQKVSKQTTAVLKSTGNAANVSAKHVSSLATALSKKSGIDDEAIQSGENLLLTFTKIRNETGKGNKIFDQSTRIITDMSVALGQDMKSSAIQVGKALNDPIKGVTALQRVGVSFTQKQKDQIKTLEETGHHMQAQKLILRELNNEFAGSAKAQATPFAKLKVTLGNLAETLGGKLAPYAERAAVKLNRFVNQMMAGRGEGGKFVDKLREVGLQVKDIAQKVVTDLKPVVQWFLNHPQMAAVALGGWASYKVGALGAISSIAGALGKAGALSNPFTAILVAAGAALVASQQTFSGFSSKTKAIFDDLKTHMDPRGIDNFAAHLQALGDKGGPFAADMRKAAAGLRSMNKPALDVQNAIDKLANGVPADMSTIATSVRLNMKLIKHEMGSKSAEAKEALSRNFMAGAERIRAAMAAGTISTKEGLAKINEYFRKDLALFGITGKQASRYLKGKDTLTGKPVAGGGGKAKGGWIGHPGQAGGDNVPIMVGRGEAVLNRHQQGPVNAALQATYGMSLGGLFSRVNRPHYMASGGFAGMVGKANQIDKQQFPYKWGGGHNSSFSGPYDCSGAVSAVLHAGGLLGAPRVSGDLMNYGKPGPGAVTIFANPTHTYMRLGGKYFGTSRANPGGGAGWFPGAPRAGFAVRHADATAATIKRVMFAGGLGALSGIGQAGLDGVRSGASSALAKVAFGGYTGGGDPPGNFAGGGFARGGVQTSNKTSNLTKAKAMLGRLWAGSRQFYPGAGASMPPTKWNSNKGVLGAFPGMLADPGGSRKGRLVNWPKFMIDMMGGNNAQQSALAETAIHEWAHYFQSPSVNRDFTKAEGGAQAFTRQVAPYVFNKVGLPYTVVGRASDSYLHEAHLVHERYGNDWIRHGQFVGMAKGGFVGKAMASGGFVGAAGLASLAGQAGFPASAIPLAVAVALAESGGRTTASHRNANGSIDRGLWQINSSHGRQSTFNPLRNARAAFAISKHGRNWNPWTMYRNGRYKRFLGKARKVAGKVATGGMGQIGAATGGVGTLGGDVAGQFTGAGSYVPAAGTFQVPPPAADDTATTDSGEDPNQPLIDSNNALAAANQALADAERELRAEVKRWNDFSTSVAAVTSVQAIKALSDVISGQIVGTGYRGRALTASAGSTVRY